MVPVSSVVFASIFSRRSVSRTGPVPYHRLLRSEVRRGLFKDGFRVRLGLSTGAPGDRVLSFEILSNLRLAGAGVSEVGR
jgi:hypothetical protein